ncbi:aminoglycoside N(3)-acetyltransferase [Streptomyces sp. ODS05-4]|uniref:aminoglycoside N(3)-acetyltransferase n=1 Tax=Streptomyces sp. ODS05-4 TaxID=2944939 RepID=UPI00210E2AA8|nr:AAC(3) family N-acetyltransferase [Streptomyces sp. ODS05-4]
MARVRVTGAPVHSERLLRTHLGLLGVEPGDVLLVHSSLRAVGPVAGRGDGVLRALLGALGPHGTLVVPAFTAGNSDTSPAYRDRVRGLTPEQVRAVRAAMAPYDPDTTPSDGVGVFPELVRAAPGALRSRHPQTSFAALGPYAEKVLSGHRADNHLGEDSPLARLYELGARVLMLGTGWEACSAFHLAEYRTPAPPRRSYRCVVRAGTAGRRWWEYEDVALADGDFGALGAELEARRPDLVRSGRVGAAAARLVELPGAVDFARDWLTRHR